VRSYLTRANGLQIPKYGATREAMHHHGFGRIGFSGPEGAPGQPPTHRPKTSPLSLEAPTNSVNWSPQNARRRPLSWLSFS